MHLRSMHQAHNINFSFNGLVQSKYKFVICDLNGNEFLSGLLNNAEGKYYANADVSNLHTGIYTLKIAAGLNVVAGNFLKE